MLFLVIQNILLLCGGKRPGKKACVCVCGTVNHTPCKLGRVYFSSARTFEQRQRQQELRPSPPSPRLPLLPLLLLLPRPSFAASRLVSPAQSSFNGLRGVGGKGVTRVSGGGRTFENRSASTTQTCDQKGCASTARYCRGRTLLVEGSSSVFYAPICEDSVLL